MMVCLVDVLKISQFIGIFQRKICFPVCFIVTYYERLGCITFEILVTLIDIYISLVYLPQNRFHEYFQGFYMNPGTETLTEIDLQPSN